MEHTLCYAMKYAALWYVTSVCTCMVGRAVADADHNEEVENDDDGDGDGDSSSAGVVLCE